MKKSEIESIATDFEQAIEQVTTMSRRFGPEEALGWLIGGRDCMLVSRAELDSAVGRINQLVGWSDSARDLAALAELKNVLGYATGIQYARMSLWAAGVEVAA
jgi:hypothetical protein